MCCNVELPAGADAYMEKTKAAYADCAKEGGADIPMTVQCIAKKYKMVRSHGLPLGVDVEFL